MTEASLGFRIDSSQASSAAADLDKLTAAAERTQQGVDKLEAEAAGLGRAIGKAGEDARRALPAIDSLGRSFGTQDEQVSAFRAELERLGAEFPHLAEAAKQYKSNISDIQLSHRAGWTSAQQMTQALERERLAFERLKTSATTAGAAVRGANASVRAGATGNARAAGTNAGYLVQDIGVSAAMGMSPAMIGLQQGTQLSAALTQMGSGRQAIAGLGAAFASIVHPVSLVTVGLTAGVAALVQYFSTAESGAAKAAALLEQQNNTIRRAAELWGSAVPQFQAYVNELDRADKITQGRAASEILAGRELEGLGEKLKALKQEFTQAMRDLRGMDADPAFIRDFGKAFGDLRQRLDDGTATIGDYNRAQMALAEAVSRYGVKSVLGFRDAFNQTTSSIRYSIEAAKQARTEWIAAIAGGTSVEEIIGKKLFTDNGKTFRPSDFIPRNPPVPTGRPNIELGADRNDSALSPALTRLLKADFSGSSESANDLSSAISGIGTAAQTANTGIIDVSQNLAMAQFKALSAMEKSSSQLRSMETELTNVNTALKDAANIPPSELFGGLLSTEAGSKAIADAASSVEKVMSALRNGGITADKAHESLEIVRSTLKALGGDAAFVDRLVDSLVAGHGRALELKGGIEQLSRSIQMIPNRVIDIGIRQYTVGTAGGGSKAVTVHGASGNMQTLQYDVGGGKTVGVTSFGNGSQASGGTTQSRYSLGGKTITVHGTRAAGGPTESGKTYLVGEGGPELLTMAGAGQVSSANATASILSGGRDTLSMMEDHLYQAVQELRVHTNYFETFESDLGEMITCLKALKTASVSYSGVSSSSSASGAKGMFAGGSGGGSGGKVWSHLDPMAPYYFDASRSMAGTSGARYDPVADALLNGNVNALNGVGGSWMDYTSRMGPGSGGTGPMPSLLDRLKVQLGATRPSGFDTGGQIMAGEEQRVEFFKRRKERVIIVDDDKVSDQRGGRAATERPSVNAPMNFHFHGDTGDARSRQAMADEVRRTVLSVLGGR